MDTAISLLQALAAADNHMATKTGELKQAKQEYDAIADRLFALMDEQGTESLRNTGIGLQVSISETETDTIEDYEAFSRYVLRHKLIHLFTRRLSSTAVKERIQATGKPIPGLGKFKKRRLHVTKYSK